MPQSSGPFDVRASLGHASIGAAVDHRSDVREELPVVSRRIQSHLEDAEMAPVGRFGPRIELRTDAVVLPAGARDDLPDAVRVRSAVRVELREALIVVLVSVE